MPPKMTLDELRAFMRLEFPQINAVGREYEFEAVGAGTSRLRLNYGERHLRPGGTISGPAMMSLADLALYVAILGGIGPVKLAVTTNLSFNFLRKPEPRDLIGECRMLKHGRRLAIGEVSIYSDGQPDLVAHATGTYSIPPR